MTKTNENVMLGARFREERVRLGYTQKGLATRLRSTDKTLIGYESGEVLPKLSTLILFHGAGADLGYILVGERRPADLDQPSTPAERLAADIAGLPLSAADAELLVSVARRLAAKAA